MVGLARSTLLVGALYLSSGNLREAFTDPSVTGIVANLVQSGMAILAG